MPSAILSQFTAPAIDGQAVKRVLAPVIMENIVQDIILKDGYGVTEKFSTDTDAFEIRVVRQNALDLNARKFGATVNGGFFNSLDELQPSSTEYGIRLDHVIDKNIDIPSNMQDMFPLDVVGATTTRIGQQVAKNVNASTMAEQIKSNLNYCYTSGTPNWVEVDLATGNFLTAFMTASSQLDNGDEDNGIDIFPVDQRVALWRPELRAKLLASGQVILGASSFAQKMISAGKVSPDGRPRENMGGYFGDIDVVPQHIVSSAVFNLAERFLTKSGSAVATGTLDNVHGMVLSGLGTGRALAFNNTVKTIDSPAGQGMRLQPKYRWGVETWFPKSIVLIVEDGFVNPADATDTLSILPVESQA